MSKTPNDGTSTALPPAGGVDTYAETPFSDNWSVCNEIASKDAAAIEKFNKGTLGNQ
jgi:hypothetical protein